MLLAFGTDAEAIIPTMTTLGDVASGVGMSVTELAEIYGKNMVQGRLQMEDINQLMGRGIPITQALAKQFGVAESEVRGMVSSGQVTSAHMKKAFESMAGEGGKFAGMMAKQSNTLGGLMSTLSDTVGNGLMRIAQTVIDAFDLKEGIKSLTSGIGTVSSIIVSGVQKVAPFLKTLFTIDLKIFTAIWGTVGSIIGKVFTVVSTLFSAIQGTIVTVGTAIWTSVQTVWNSVYGFVSGIVTSVAGFIAVHWESILQTTVGVWMGVWNVISSVWGAVSGIVTTVWGAITAAWEWGTNLIAGRSVSSGEVVSGVFSSVVKTFQWLQGAVTTALNVVSWSITNWQDAADLAATSALLGIVSFANQVTYFFTDVVPGVAVWFANNWRDIFTDIGSFTATVFSNLAGNIVSIISNIPGLITGDVSFGDLWTPLTDGFEASLRELPQIADREAGALESSLIDRRDALAEGLGSFLADKEQSAQAVADDIAEGINNAFATPDKIEAPPVEKPETPPIDMQARITNDDLTVNVTPKIGEAKAIMANSAEAQRAKLLGGLQRTASLPSAVTPTPSPQGTPPTSPEQSPSMRATASDMIAKMVELAKRQMDQLDQINRNTAGLRGTEIEVI